MRPGSGIYIILALSILVFFPLHVQAGTDKLYSEKLKKNHGKISALDKNYILINIGWDNGITSGMTFKVFDQDNNFVDRLEVRQTAGNNISITVLSEKDGSSRIKEKRKEVKVGYLVELEVENSNTASTEEKEIQLKRLKNKDWQVRVDAMDILAKTGGLDILPEIFLILNENLGAEIANNLSESENNFRIRLRRSATWALGEISFRVFSQIFIDSKNEPALVKEKEELLNRVTDKLVELCSDTDKNVSLDAARNISRLIAIRQIFGLETDHFLDPFAEILMREQDSYIKRAIIEILAELKDERAISVLLAVWDDKDPIVRTTVSWALEKIGFPVVPFLKEIINGQNEEKKKEAVHVLYRLGFKIKKNKDKYEIGE